MSPDERVFCWTTLENEEALAGADHYSKSRNRAEATLGGALTGFLEGWEHHFVIEVRTRHKISAASPKPEAGSGHSIRCVGAVIVRLMERWRSSRQWGQKVSYGYRATRGAATVQPKPYVQILLESLPSPNSCEREPREIGLRQIELLQKSLNFSQQLWTRLMCVVDIFRLS